MNVHNCELIHVKQHQSKVIPNTFQYYFFFPCLLDIHSYTVYQCNGSSLTWFFKSSLGHGRPPLKAFSLSHLDLIFNPLPQDTLQADQADQSLSLQSMGQGMWQTSTV